MSPKKNARSSQGFLVHNDLKEKLIIGCAISGPKWSDFARELANVLHPKINPSTDDLKELAGKLVGRISKVISPLKTAVRSQATYELIEGTSQLLGINGPSKELLAQMSVVDYFGQLKELERDALVKAINLPLAEESLIIVGEKCGIHRETSEVVVLSSFRRDVGLNENLHPIYLDIGKFEFFDLDRGHDVTEVQKYMYFDSGAVNNWGALISDADNNYPNYRHCKESLNDFLNDDYWKNLVNDNQISRTINLGAGTPDKDRAIISSGTTQKECNRDIVLPTHYIVDSSLYMLLETIKELCYSQYHNRKIAENEPITVSGDFMQLSKLIPRYECDQDGNPIGRSAFFMLGGTIGNINPRHFMESILAVANKGDLLIVSAEFLPSAETEIESFKISATASYNHYLAKQLVAPAARAVLRSQKYRHLKDKDAAEEDIILRLKATSRLVTHKRSSLPNILKIVFEYEHDRTKFDVVEANRYVETEFIDFVCDHGFSYVQQHGENQPKQIIFEKA